MTALEMYLCYQVEIFLSKGRFVYGNSFIINYYPFINWKKMKMTNRVL